MINEIKLYIVPTPIGNLDDITIRAIDTLKNSDLILSEDTRHAKKLLSHYKISTKVKSYHLNNEHKKVDDYIGLMVSGKKISLITDAGTPCISDPGFLLVRACIQNEINIECLPGATAFVPALVNSGFPMDRFLFEGFLPVKKGRTKRLKELSISKKTMVFYESPHRVLKTLKDFGSYFSLENKISISRELTKIYEETFRGTIEEALKHFEKNKPKGEFVIVLSTN